MNLAFLIGQFPPGVFGGAELQAEQWARRLATRHRVTVVTRSSPQAAAGRTTRDGIDVIRVPVSRWPGLRSFRDLAAIRRVVKELEPRPDLLLCFQTFISGFAGVGLQRSLGIPAVVWVRGEDELRLRAIPSARWTSPGVWRQARGVIVQSPEIRDALLSELPADQRPEVAAHLECVPNGIRLPAPRAASARGDRVLTVGRLVDIKGMDVVIDAVAAAGARLTIAGDGPERQRLEQRAAQLRADVRFAGFVAPEALADLYRDAACAVLASRFGEGFPNVVLEAMAHGCAVIATRVTGVGELIEDGVNGLMVPPGDPRALGAAMTRLAGDRGLAERLGAAARHTAEGYAWERVEPRLEALLERWGARA
jgi:glycosyltransferase involved in cell wall biosynthesis